MDVLVKIFEVVGNKILKRFLKVLKLVYFMLVVCGKRFVFRVVRFMFVNLIFLFVLMKVGLNMVEKGMLRMVMISIIRSVLLVLVKMEFLVR